MICTGASATGCKIGGIASLSNSTVRAHNATVTANVGSAYVARAGGLIETTNGTTTNNDGYGVSVEDGAYVLYTATNTGNTLGAVNAFSFFSAEGGQARVASSVGPLRLDTRGPSPVYVNTSSGLQLELLHVAGVVNHPYVAGGAAGSPARVGATGADANVDLALEPKGTGKIKVGATQVLPAGFAANSIVELKAADGAVIQIPCKKL